MPDKISRHMVWGKRIALALAAPVVIFVVAEGILALAGSFPPRRLLIREMHSGSVIYRSNPECGRWFLPRREIPMPSPVWTAEDKKPDTFRVVLLGESAAAGFPHPEFNLARTLEHVWSIRHPHQRLEVVNLTMVGVNSHLLRQFAREARVLNPDALIVYAGHNEAIGPYGPASVFGRLYGFHWMIRADLWLRNTRVGRALHAMGMVCFAGTYGRDVPRWAGLEEFGSVRIAADDPRLDVMARHARANFRNIVDGAIREGVKVVVALPAVNLNDWPPLASNPAQLDDEAALAAWRRGDTNALMSAAQVYRLAKRIELGGDMASAWPLYRLALELDLCRFRADRRIRSALDSMRGYGPQGMLQLVDADRRLHEENPLFLTDREYFCEHVHLTFDGRAAVAMMLVDALTELFDEPVTGAREVVLKDLAARMLFTPMDEAILWRSARDLLTLGVFAGQPDAEERQAAMKGKIEWLLAEADNQWDVETLMRHYEEAMKQQAEDPMLSFTAGRWLEFYKKLEEAVPLLRRGLAGLPNYPQGRLLLAQILMALGRLDEAESELDLVARYSHDMPLLWVLRGEWLARKGRLQEARHDLEAVRRAMPDYYSALVNLANVYLLLGEDRLALDAFADCLRLDELDPGVLNNYAWLSATSDAATGVERTNALRYIDRAIEIRPGYNRHQAARALALAVRGRRDEAGQAARIGLHALRQSRDDQIVADFLRHLDRMQVPHDP